jgi:cysteine-rich repeat protein
MKRLLLLLLAGCVENPLVICDNGRACPVGLVCDDRHETCVLPTQFEACAGKEDGVRCMYPGITAGTCAGGVCFPAICGGGFVDSDEECDDGNQLNGDGCSAECTREECGNGRLDLGELCDDGDLRNHDGCNSVCADERPDWHQLSLVPIGYRMHPGVNHDAIRERTMLFGGASAGITNDTWEWFAQTWSSLTTLSGPSRRLAMSVTFDAARREIVLFGGLVNGTMVANDTWVYDGVRWQQRVTTVAPSTRNRAALTYDSKRKRVVLFGGFNGDSLDDTWEWDGVTWVQQMPVVHPSPRTPTAMAFDAKQGVTLIAGGYDIDGLPIEPTDTWTWDGTTWTRLSPATTPTGSSLTMAYDPQIERTVLLTFESNKVHWWEWTGNDWLNVPANELPNLQDGSVMFYDQGIDRLVVFGLRPGNILTLFELGPNGWVSPSDPVEPRERDATALSYDATRGDVLMFGGEDGSVLLDDLWRWDGSRWTEINRSGTWPAARHSHASAYDVGRGELIVVGGRTASGRSGETWAWNGSTWRLAGTLPPHEQFAVAYDARRKRFVAFGGTALGFDGFDHHVAETWEWNGSTWTEIAIGSGPPARSGHGLVYDAHRDRIVMFGGASEYEAFNDVWELDGATWQVRTTTVVPPQRSAHAMVYDPQRATTVVIGGKAAALDGGGPLGDTWEWDGTNWTPIATFSTPTRREGRVAAYHAGSGRILMFGGAAQETWQFGYEGDLPPEVCGGGHDVDRDGLVGCGDPDCWWTCSALCPPHTSCTGEGPACGDGVCAPLENCRLCPADCGSCAPQCGDFLCDTGETCPGDCGP